MKKSNDAPLFYIIVTSYNRAELLGRAINSVLQQDNPNWRILSYGLHKRLRA